MLLSMSNFPFIYKNLEHGIKSSLKFDSNLHSNLVSYHPLRGNKHLLFQLHLPTHCPPPSLYTSKALLILSSTSKLCHVFFSSSFFLMAEFCQMSCLYFLEFHLTLWPCSSPTSFNFTISSFLIIPNPTTHKDRNFCVFLSAGIQRTCK